VKFHAGDLKILKKKGNSTAYHFVPEMVVANETRASMEETNEVSS